MTARLALALAGAIVLALLDGCTKSEPVVIVPIGVDWGEIA